MKKILESIRYGFGFSDLWFRTTLKQAPLCIVWACVFNAIFGSFTLLGMLVWSAWGLLAITVLNFLECVAIPAYHEWTHER